MNELSYVWLEEAFAWTCEGCKRRNRSEWVPEELDSQTIDELKEDGEEIRSGVFSYRLPYKVKCPRCKCMYVVANHIEEEEEGEEAEEDDDW